MSISANPLPVFKATFTFPAKAGVIIPDGLEDKYKCEVSGFQVSVEITHRPPVRTPTSITTPVAEEGIIFSRSIELIAYAIFGIILLKFRHL